MDSSFIARQIFLSNVENRDQDCSHISGLLSEDFFFLALMNLSAHLLLLTIATVSKEPMGITGYEGTGLTCFVIK